MGMGERWSSRARVDLMYQDDSRRRGGGQAYGRRHYRRPLLSSPTGHSLQRIRDGLGNGQLNSRTIIWPADDELLMPTAATDLPVAHQHGADVISTIDSKPQSNGSATAVLRSSTTSAVIRRGSALVLGGFAMAAKLATAFVARVFFGKAWPFFQTFSLSTLFIHHHPSEVKVSKAAEVVIKPFHMLVGPVLCITISECVLKWCWPDAYRTLKFWCQLLPIYAGYMNTKLQVRKKSFDERDKAWALRHEWGGEKVYKLISDMSGFYVKSAQILASKAEFVPKAWAKHLSKLLDSAPPSPFHDIEISIGEQLAKCPWSCNSYVKGSLVPLDAVFSEVEKEPLAAASIAQVHGGILKHGVRVAIKVQHRGMEVLMRSDLRNIAWLAKFLQGQLPVDLFPIVKEIQKTIPLEFDFEREVWFMTAIRNSLATNGFHQIVCPLPYSEYCSKRLIVMERVDGTPFTHILHPVNKNLQSRLPDAQQAVRHLLRAYGQMIFLDGVFHADPHAGNLFLLSDGRLGLLDYGQSKQIDRTLCQRLSRMILALCEGNDLSIALALLNIGLVFEPEDRLDVPISTVATAARILFDVCYVEEATVSPMSQNSILQTIPLKKFNQEVWMVVRTNLLLRGLCFSLNLDISAAKIWRPYAMMALQKQ